LYAAIRVMRVSHVCKLQQNSRRCGLRVFSIDEVCRRVNRHSPASFKSCRSCAGSTLKGRGGGRGRNLKSFCRVVSVFKWLCCGGIVLFVMLCCCVVVLLLYCSFITRCRPQYCWGTLTLSAQCPQTCVWCGTREPGARDPAPAGADIAEAVFVLVYL
jgi:hypothetical protein